MIRSFILAIMAISSQALAGFSCPSDATFLEHKDKVQWMKACKDGDGKLHGPFEIWTRLPESLGKGLDFKKMTSGQYFHGKRIGKWTHWDSSGNKVENL